MAERGLCVGNTYLNHKSLYKYTRGTRGQDGEEVKNMIDLVLMKKDMMCYVQDMRAMIGIGRCISNHHAGLCKVRLVRAWIKRRDVVVGARRIRSEKLSEDLYGEGYARPLDWKRVE